MYNITRVIRKCVFALALIVLALSVMSSCSAVYDLVNPNRRLIIDNDLYISGEFANERGGDIAESFFPKYSEIKDIADFEYRYFSLNDDEYLNHSWNNTRRFRSLFMLELCFEKEEDYFASISTEVDGKDTHMSGISGDIYGYVIESEYTSFPETVAYLMCHDEIKVLSYLLFVDTTYTGAHQMSSRMLRDIPSEIYCYSEVYWGELSAITTLMKCKVPTGSMAISHAILMESDQFGRALYRFECAGELLNDYSEERVYGYIIIQKSQDNKVFYYDDTCLLLSLESLHVSSDNYKSFVEENDWNKPLDESKCDAKEILMSPIDDSVVFDNVKLEVCISEEFGYASFVYDVCDQNDDGKILVFVREKSYDEGQKQLGKPNVLILNDNGGSYTIVGRTQINDMLNVKAVENFKKNSNW